MTSAADGFTALCFSTDALPARDRVAAFREVFGRKLARCEFEPLEHPFHVDITLCGLPVLAWHRLAIPACASAERAACSPMATMHWCCRS
jgi:hypothetical protein